jgi:hypothetical protein
MAKAAFNKAKVPFTRKSDLHLRKKPVKCYIWSTALFGAENWTIRKVDQRHLQILKCGTEEGWKKSVGPIV